MQDNSEIRKSGIGVFSTMVFIIFMMVFLSGCNIQKGEDMSDTLSRVIDRSEYILKDYPVAYFKDLKTGGSKIVADKNKTLSKVLCLDGNKLFAVDREDQLVLFTIQ